MPDYDYQSDTRPFSRVLEDIGAKKDPKLYLGELVDAFGGNLVPALIISTFGFGLMQRDGLVVLVGWAGVAGVGVFIWLAWELVSRAFLAVYQMTGLG